MTTLAPGSVHRGTLREEPLPRLLHRSFRERITGVLSLVSPAGTSEVYLSDGYPVAVELPGAIDRLGSLLVASGALDPGSHKQSLATPPPVGHPYGRMLREQGSITREQLLSALVGSPGTELEFAL